MYYEDDLAPRMAPKQMLRPVYSGSHHPPTDARTQSRAQPPLQVIDLTSSPRRPPSNGDSGYYVSAHSHAAVGSSGLSNVPVSSRRSPVREANGTQYEVQPGEPPRAYMPNSGVYERRAPPARDYIPVRDDYQRRPIEGEDARYLRSGFHYRGPNLQ